MLILDVRQMDYFLRFQRILFIPNQVISFLDILLPSPLCLMPISDNDLNAISDTLCSKNSPDVRIIIGPEQEKVKYIRPFNRIKCQ